MTEIPMKSRLPTRAKQHARRAMLAALKPFADELGNDTMLAVLAYTVGQLIALQDQRKMTAEMAMATVSANIEQGNRDAIAATLGAVRGQG